MGFIRGALVTILTILLFVSLFSTAAFLTVSMSLDYNVIKPEIHTIVNNIILNQTDMDEQFDEALKGMQFYCQTNTVFSQPIEEEGLFENYSLEIPCEVVKQGTDSIITYLIDDLVEKNYYKEYDCGFMDCFEQEGSPFFLLSEHTRDYFKGWFYTGLIVSIILAGLLFFFVESKTSFPFFLGAILIVVSFIFLGIGKLLPLLIGWEYAQIVLAFFTQSYPIFLVFLILGIVSIGIGIILKFLFIGRFFANLFKKDEKLTKKDLKEAIEESKKRPKKKKK